MTSLYPHQEEAVQRIMSGAATYLGFDMGLGKTRAAIEAAMRRRLRRVLVFCPASAVLVWRNEVRRWAADRATIIRTGADLAAAGRFAIVSYGHLSRPEGTVLRALERCADFDMTVIDEAHYLKDMGAKRTKAFMRLRPKLGQLVPMSGTPAPNHAGELYPMLAACFPVAASTASGQLMSRFQFEDAFCVVGSRHIGRGRSVRVIEGSKNLDILSKRIKPFMFRKRKHEVLRDLPPLTWSNVPVAIDPIYAEGDELIELTTILRERLATAKAAGDYDQMVDILRSADGDVHLMKLRRILGMAKLPGAVAYIDDMLNALPLDRKVVVFAVHRHVCSGLAAGLGDHGPVMLTGASTLPERADAMRRFLEDKDCRVFIGNIKAAGTALTLVGPSCACSDVVFVESAWSPSDNAQAACRVHRIGQRDAVVSRMLYADDTIDEIVMDILARKARDFSQLFDKENA